MAENQEEPTSQEATQAAPPTPTSKPDLVSEFELPDSSFDSALDDEVSPAKPKSTSRAAALPPSEEPEEITTPPASSPRQRNEDGTFKKKHADRWVRVAKDLGISDDEIADASPEQLRETIRDLHTHAQVTAVSRQGLTDPNPTHRDQPAPPAAEQLLSRDAGFDPVLVDTINTIGARLQYLERHHHTKAQEESFTAADTAMAKYPALGKATKDPSSPDFKRRKAVMDLVRADNSSGDLQDKIDAAYTTLFGGTDARGTDAYGGKEAPPKPAKNGRFTREQWDASGVARPTQRAGSKEPKGDKRAMQAVAARMDELGVKGDDYESFEENGLPE